ncbi:MAG TPA: MFS transporter [Rhizomicrobium sp.]|nr:MFS transporter [Rhizomicrobium sp.]
MSDTENEAQQDAELETAFASVTTPAERKRAFVILFLSLVCMGAGQTVLYAILPPAARELHLSALQMTSVVSVSALIWVFSSTYWGLKSDKWGRKPVMLLGLTAFGVSFALLALTLELGLRHILPVAFVFPVMVAMRSIYGTLGSGTAPAAQAYVADRTTMEERLQGIATINAAFSLGTALGPGIIVLSAIDLLAPFYFVSLLAIGSGALIWYFLPERTPPKSHRREFKSSLQWYDRRILPFVIFTVGLSLIGTIPVQTMGFFFIDVLRIPAKDSTQFTMVGQIASAMSALVAQLLVVQQLNLSVRQLTAWGCIAIILGFVIFMTIGQFAPLVFALVLIGFGFGMARPGFTSAASLAVTADEQGAVAGILGGASATGFIAGPVVGAMYDASPYLPYAFGAAALVALLAFMLISPTLRNAGVIPPDIKLAEKAPATPVANA